MTPSQKLKHAILLKAVHLECITDPGEITADNVDQLYEDNDQDWRLQDAREEVRCSGTETGLDCDYGLHYESDAVAAKMPDGSWVGWTYWYGGGKHGEPEAVDWIPYAYDLTCTEEEVTVIKQTFAKA